MYALLLCPPRLQGASPLSLMFIALWRQGACSVTSGTVSSATILDELCSNLGIFVQLQIQEFCNISNGFKNTNQQSTCVRRFWSRFGNIFNRKFMKSWDVWTGGLLIFSKYCQRLISDHILNHSVIIFLNLTIITPLYHLVIFIGTSYSMLIWLWIWM